MPFFVGATENEQMDNSTTPTTLPSFAAILADHPGWLDEAISTKEASRIVHEAVPSLETKRVRGGGPAFIKRGKKVSYTRRACFEYLRAGHRTSTSDPGEEAAA